MNTVATRTRREVRAHQIAALVAEQEAEEREVRGAIKHAAFARCDAVQQLYETLGVAPEKPLVRQSKNGPQEVSQDRDETKRAARLVAAVGSLMAEVERLRTEVAQARQPNQARGPETNITEQRAVTGLLS